MTHLVLPAIVVPVWAVALLSARAQIRMLPALDDAAPIRTKRRMRRMEISANVDAAGSSELVTGRDMQHASQFPLVRWPSYEALFLVGARSPPWASRRRRRL